MKLAEPVIDLHFTQERRHVMRNKLLVSLSVLSLFALAGCGSSSKESGNQTGTFKASAACIECHAVNKISPVTGAAIVGEWEKSAHNLNNGAACTDCHTNSGHPGGGSIIKAVADTQCGTCHTVAKLGYPHFSPFANITAAQYVSQTDAAGVQCRQCHNPHNTTSLIQYNKDWAESGHGDVGYVAGNTNASSVNSHYGWTTAGRDACAKCHTTTGYKKVTNGGVTILDGVVTAGGPIMKNNKKNEAIMCSACHNDYSWTRRSIGAQTLEYRYDSGSGPVVVVLPDAKDSNLCLVCHSGRGNGQSARSTRFAGHHAPTGADLYAQYTHFGYEFTGLDYTKKAFFAHDTIGIADGSGPCVSCHMKSGNSHTFAVAKKDANGAITAINTQSVCNTCHNGNYAMTAAKLEEESAGYQQAGLLLKAYLLNTIANYHNKPITDSSGAPIDLTGAKYAVPDPTKTPQLKTGTVDIASMLAIDYGAFQNSLLPTEDPGGYAHNRFYVKRLLFDSIDALDNGALDGSITINATTYPEAAVWFGAAATTGVAERP